MSLYHAAAQTRAVGLARLWRRFARRNTDDPFVVLALQLRLGAVANHLRRIEMDTRMYARGERWIAAKDAYDTLLADACQIAGVPPAHAPTEGERLRVELELTSRGWSW